MITNGKFTPAGFLPYSSAEDSIIIELYGTVWSLRDISKGLFNRTHGSVANRVRLLKRARLITK